MDDVMKVVVAIFAAIALILFTTWVFTIAGVNIYGYTAPREAAIERKTFEETKSYNQGMIQELQNMQFEYLKATKEQQVGLANIILHRTADYDDAKLPQDLRLFVQGLRASRK